MSRPSSDGRTATHETGHYLGLNHTFRESQNGGCCDNDDDNVNDTPASYYNNNGEDVGLIMGLLMQIQTITLVMTCFIKIYLTLTS